MLTRDRGLSLGDTAGLVSEISAQVSTVSAESLPEVLARALEVAALVSDEEGAAAFLFDYTSDLLHVRREDGKSHSQPVDDGSPFPHMQVFADPGAVSWHEQIHCTSSDGSSLVTLPLTAGAFRLGLLGVLLQRTRDLTLPQQATLTTIANLAALAIDRCRRQRNSLAWLDASASIVAASRPVDAVSRASLLQQIADSARVVAAADFVLLYEYFEERDDVAVPPILAGRLRDEAVLSKKNVVLQHKESAVFRLLRNGVPFYAPRGSSEWVAAGLIDAVAAARPRSFFAREGVQSSFGIPLQADREQVGVLFVNYRTPQVLSVEFRRHFQLFANQAALVIGNARFFQRSESYRQKLELLNRIGRALGSALSPDIAKIGEQIDSFLHDDGDRAKESLAFPTQNFLLCRYEPDRDRFSLPYLRDEQHSPEDLEPRLHEGLTALICRTREPLLLDREQQEKLFADGKARRVGEPAAVWLGAPLVIRDKVIGAIVIQDYDDENALTEQNKQLLTAIAAQAAIAIDNAQLLEEASLRLEELSALLDLSQDLALGQRTPTQLLSSTLDHLCRLSRCDGSLLLLVDPGDRDTLRITAASRTLEKYLGKSLKRGEGVSGQVVGSGEPLIIDDYPSWPDRSQLFDPLPQRVCALPLVLKNEVIGVLTLSSDRVAGQFSQREIEILKRFAGPAAVALSNARDVSFRKALIETVPNAIVAIDKLGRITEFNEEAVKLFDSGTTLRGERVETLYWNGREEAMRVKQLLRKEGRVRDIETFARTREGEKVPVSLTAAFLKDESGDIIGSFGVLEDLRLQSLRTRTHLFVEVLRELSRMDNLEEMAKEIVDSAVMLLYADAGCLFMRRGAGFIPTYLSSHEESSLDRLQGGDAESSLSALLAEDVEDIIYPLKDDRCGDLRLLPNARSAVLAPVRTDKRLLALLLVESRQSHHFSGDQTLLSILASQVAVSINRIQLLHYREEVEKGLQVSANAIAVGQIATTFLHEAKNSLNSMNLIALSLLEDIESSGEIDSKQKYLDRLTMIRQEVSRFDGLSRRLQRFTHERLRPVKSEAYVNDIVRETVKLLGSTLKSKDMKYQTRFDPSLDPPAGGKGKGNPVLVDADQIQQALMNLILNAVAASRDRQPLLIETRSHERLYEVRVTDYGAGIAPETRPKLFKPFFTTRDDGVGLGLYISRVLIQDNHGGSIEFSSSGPGKGSTFSIMLPQ